VRRRGVLLGLALLTGLAAGAPEALAAGAGQCGQVCVYDRPGFKGRRVCYRHPANTTDIGRAWGKGFVPGSVRVTRRGRCSPVAYFFTEPGYRGVVAAYFGTAANIAARRYRSFRLKHTRLED